MEQSTRQIRSTSAISRYIQFKTRRVAVYVKTRYNIASKRAFPTGILERWQLFTYLLTHELFSSGIWQYLVPVTQWCQRYLLCYLLSVSSLLFCALSQFRVILLDDLAVIWRRNHTYRMYVLCRIVKFVYERALNVAENVFLCAAYSPG